MWIKFSTSHMLNVHFTTELHLQPLTHFLISVLRWKKGFLKAEGRKKGKGGVRPDWKERKGQIKSSVR